MKSVVSRPRSCLLTGTGEPWLTVPALVFVALFGLLASHASAQKTDVVHLSNGNVIVGEVKKLEHGLLEFSVDDISNRLQIQWEHVTRLTSNQQLDVEVGSGDVYFGTLIESSADGELRVQATAGTFDLELSEVVLIEPIKETFWKRLEGSISAGLSFTKATDLLQFNFGGSARYRRLKSVTDLRLSSIITSKSGEEDKTNSYLQLTHYRFLKNRWFYRGDGGAARNDELGIDFRGSLAGGLGRRVVHTSRAQFLISGLISGNRELTSDGRDTNNLELVIDSSLLAYRRDTPKLDFRSDLTLFYSLTIDDRYRVDFDGRISLEFIKDLFWDISQVYYRFDSDPSKTAESSEDYGIITGLRYKFN